MTAPFRFRFARTLGREAISCQALGLESNLACLYWDSRYPSDLTRWTRSDTRFGICIFEPMTFNPFVWR